MNKLNFLIFLFILSLSFSLYAQPHDTVVDSTVVLAIYSGLEGDLSINDDVIPVNAKTLTKVALPPGQHHVGINSTYYMKSKTLSLNPNRDAFIKFEMSSIDGSYYASEENPARTPPDTSFAKLLIYTNADAKFTIDGTTSWKLPKNEATSVSVNTDACTLYITPSNSDTSIQREIILHQGQTKFIDLDLWPFLNFETSVKDQQGNEYPLIRINGTLWMNENLNIETPESYCYDNNPKNCNTYGRLYTWEAAKNACSSLGEGWELPAKEDWSSLSAMYSESNTGFNAQLGGGRSLIMRGKEYSKIEQTGLYWTRTSTGMYGNWKTYEVQQAQPESDLQYHLKSGAQKQSAGCSVRCVKALAP